MNTILFSLHFFSKYWLNNFVTWFLSTFEPKEGPSYGFSSDQLAIGANTAFLIFLIGSTFFIAEISANHSGNIINAKKLIKSAKKNGADAVKIQTYRPETMTINSRKKTFRIKHGLWKNSFIWDLYKQGHTPYEWHKELFEYAKKLNILIFSTPFDKTAVELLTKLKCPLYKVASFEITDLPLIKKIAQTKKPMIISTGMANLNEIREAVNTARKYGCKDLALLYCVSNYPSRLEDFNLNNIQILKKMFKCTVGLSDHSEENIVAISSVAAGAEVVEKHISLDNDNSGLDSEFSISGNKIKKFKDDILKAKKLLGKNYFLRNKSEDKNKIFRRSIYVSQNIKKGEKFSNNNLKILRPLIGLQPKFFFKIVGKKSPKNFKKNSPLKININQFLKKK